MLRAGQLTERIEILTTNVVKNEYGEEETNYTHKFFTRAAVRQTGGARTEENSEIVYPYSKEFIVRFYHKIEDTDIIEWRGTRYRILSIDPDRTNKQLVIDAVKIEK